MSTVNRYNNENDLGFTTIIGAMCGIAMAIILMLFQLTGNDISPAGKLVNYVVLFVGITYALYKLTNDKSGSVFTTGIMAGMKISLIAAVILVALNVVLFLINPDFAFSKYSLMPDSGINMLTISAILFFETFVIGNIIAFINMQYFKNKSES